MIANDVCQLPAPMSCLAKETRTFMLKPSAIQQSHLFIAMHDFSIRMNLKAAERSRIGFDSIT